MADVTLFGKKMNHDVFLAKVRYLLVVYLIEQTLDFHDAINAKELKYLKKNDDQTSVNNMYVRKLCQKLLVNAL